METINTFAQQAVFVDDSALITFMDPDNPHYAKARSFFIDLDDLDRHFVTTNYVLFAAHQWLRDRHGYAHAEFFLDTIDKSAEQGRLTVIPGHSEWEKEARQFVSKHPDFRFSLAEAVSSIVLMRFQISRIFTFNPNYMMLQMIYPDLKIIPSSV